RQQCTSLFPYTTLFRSSDVLYIEELIGPDTINTMPPATMDAFREHGNLRASLEEDLDGARDVMETLDRLGISIDEITAKILDDGDRKSTRLNSSHVSIS